MAPKKRISVKVVRDRGRLLSVFGPFNAYALIQVPTEVANDLWPNGLAEAARPDVVEAVERELEELDAGSALAATALAMAYEMQDPYNSATSKSMCAKVLTDTMEKVRAAAPPQKQEDRVDEIAKRRARRVGGAAS